MGVPWSITSGIAQLPTAQDSEMKPGQALYPGDILTSPSRSTHSLSKVTGISSCMGRRVRSSGRPTPRGSRLVSARFAPMEGPWRSMARG